MRIAANGHMFDIPISKEQASLLLSKLSPGEPDRPPAPPSAEEMSLFAQFVPDLSAEEGQEFYDEGDDL
jgi:hypothetical protein